MSSRSIGRRGRLPLIVGKTRVLTQDGVFVVSEIAAQAVTLTSGTGETTTISYADLSDVETRDEDGHQYAVHTALLPEWDALSEASKQVVLARLEWPEDVGGPGKQMTVTNNGAGFGDAKQNAVVEAAAMAAVLEFYGDDWESKDVSPYKVGWDITFTHKTGPESYKVEVKGVSGSQPIVLLTANELRAAEAEPEWILAVVTRALSDPQVVEYTARDALTAAKPYVFRARMPDMT